MGTRAAPRGQRRAGSESVGFVSQAEYFSSVFLAFRRHRVAQGPRLLGQMLDLGRSSRRPTILITEVADGFDVGEQFVEERQQFRQHG
jgi:hypothetical protein